MGFADVITVLPMFLRKQAYLKQRIREEHPDVLLLVDFAEFNMPLAKFARRQDVSVVYYIPPKAWAWRAKGRAKKLAKWADVVAGDSSLLKRNFTEDSGANAEFVGHPLVDFAQTSSNGTRGTRNVLILCEMRKTLKRLLLSVLMPGSRRSEIRSYFTGDVRSRCEHCSGLSKSPMDSPVSPRNFTRTYCEVPTRNCQMLRSHRSKLWKR